MTIGGGVARLRGLADRMTTVADGLLSMVPQEVWRASGGDDQQGHYEGDYRAEQLACEIRAARAALSEAHDGYAPEYEGTAPDA